VAEGPGVGKQLLYVSGKVRESIDWLSARKGNSPDRVLGLIAVTVGAHRDDRAVGGFDDDG
jgi:hypothetical protein